MRCTKLVMTALCLAVATACGTQKSTPASQSAPAHGPGAASQSAVAVTPALPKAAIVRVPVNAAGDVVGQPELRAYAGAADLRELGNAEGLNAAFESGQANPALVTKAPTQSELDKDTSTQSWGCWGARNSCGGWGASYWTSSYRPTLYWGGCGYNYSYVNYYPYPGYNYYYYQPTSYYGYGYGQRTYY